MDYYRGQTSFYRALLTDEQTKRQELLQTAIEHLRHCCGDKAIESGADQTGSDGAQAIPPVRAVLVMVKALRRAGRLGEADKLLSWLERQGLDEQMAYEVGLQRCRLLRDQGYLDTAVTGLAQLRSWCRKRRTTKELSVRLTLAYLECTIQATKAQKAVGRGDLTAAGELSRKRLEPLAEIFGAQASDQVRSIIYEQIHRTRLAGRYGTSGDELAGLETLAAGVGLAREGNIGEAVRLFDGLLSRTDSASRSLYPEALWQAGTAARGSDAIIACKYLGRLADDFPSSRRAQQAVSLAVQVAATFRAAKPDEPVAEEACFAALQRLMRKYPGSKQARRWRFYWADLLHGRGDLKNAAEQFAVIPRSDPQFVGARYYQLECQRQLLDSSDKELAADKKAELARLAREFLNLDRYVLDPESPASHRDRTSLSYGATARLAAARIFCTDLNEPETSLMLLGTFSADYADQGELLARAARYRIVALAKLGRLNEAANLTLPLLGKDAVDSAKIADAILLRIREKFADSELDAFSDEDKDLAKSWVRLARARVELTEKSDSSAEQRGRELLSGQEMIGHALFAAGQLEEALDIFTKLNRMAPGSAEYIRMSAKILLAQNEYEAAGRQWLRLIQGLKANSPEWFAAWYWALRTNFEAGGDQEKINRRIKQLQALDAKMGSEETRSRFEDLMIELDSTAAPPN